MNGKDGAAVVSGATLPATACTPPELFTQEEIGPC